MTRTSHEHNSANTRFDHSIVRFRFARTKARSETTADYADIADRKVPLHPSVSSALSAVFRFSTFSETSAFESLRENDESSNRQAAGCNNGRTEENLHGPVAVCHRTWQNNPTCSDLRQSSCISSAAAWS